MKKILTLVLLIGATIGLSSCTKEYITEVVQPNQTIFYDIKSADWTLNQDGDTWSMTLDDLPELDSYNHEYSAVLVYMMIDNGVYEQIPEVYYGLSYSYSYEVGRIDLNAQAFDAGSTPNRPPSARVKIVLIPSAE